MTTHEGSARDPDYEAALRLVRQAVSDYDCGGYQFAAVDEIIANAVVRYVRSEREAAAASSCGCRQQNGPDVGLDGDGWQDGGQR